MTQGTVKYFRIEKGYGFIAPDDGGNDIFVHTSALGKTGLSSLFEGQKVTFDVESNKRSGMLRAVNVHIAE